MAYRALLVSNWEYSDPAHVFAPLKGPRNDVVVMEKALKDDRFGLFDEVKVETNLKWTDLRAAFHGFLKAAKPDDSVLLYFSGHGDRIGEEGRLAMCGVDSDHTALATSTFDSKDLGEWIDANRARSTVVILDCCYAGAMKGNADEEIASMLGTGTVVLSSAGSQPTRDALKEDQPSPFTNALSRVLLDADLPGKDGLLTINEVFTTLTAYEPALEPLPYCNFRMQGKFPLAKREHRDRHRRPTGLPEQLPQIETIELGFEGATVTANGATAEERLDLEALDECRSAAVRRLSQLTDAILRSPDNDDDEWVHEAVRRAWNCAGSNLFETALPPGVKERVRSLTDAGRGPALLKLRLRFDDSPEGRRLEAYPWEYLYREGDPGGKQDVIPPQPVALTPGLLVERVIDAGRPEALEGPGPFTLGIVSAYRGACGEGAGRIADGVTQLANLNTVFDARAGDADWGNFVDALEQRPKFLLLFAPVRREQRGVVQIGFWDDDPKDADWHAAHEVAAMIEQAGVKFSAIVLVTFSARPAHDSFRAAPQVAKALAVQGNGPVAFVCHAPGYARLIPELGRDTFPALLLEALALGIEFDQAVYYAKNRVAMRATQDSRRCFGVPGYYMVESAEGKRSARSPGSVTGRFKPGPTARPMEKPQ